VVLPTGGAADFKVGEYKTGFASGASEKIFVPPLFQMWGYSTEASKYQSGELKFSHLYSTE